MTIQNIIKQLNKPIYSKKPSGYENLVVPETNSLVGYLELAEDIGYCPPELLMGLLHNFIRQNKIKTYKYEEVDKWLINKAKGKNWYWRPLREKDKLDSFSNISCEIYDKLIPFHALKKLKIIGEEFGDQVSFFVSDYTSEMPDPFVMVVPKNVNKNVELESFIIIFDMWDEPGFGD